MKRFPLKFDRPYIAACHDIVMAAVAFIASLYLRLGPDFWSQTHAFLAEGTIIFTAVCAIVFASMRLYRGIWRYASVDDLLAIAKAVSLAILIFALAMFVLTRLESLPRSALVITWLLLISLLGGPRLFYRVVKDRGLFGIMERGPDHRIPVVIVGTDDIADAFIRQQKKPGEQYRVLGLIDTNGDSTGRYIHGIPILGEIQQVRSVLAALQRQALEPQRILIAGAQIDGPKISQLLDIAQSQGMTIARLPRVTDFKTDSIIENQPRPIAIEDLLGRTQSRLDSEAMASLLAGRRVLITGAGGSIGSELARQVAAKNPEKIILVDHSEYNLYCIDQELSDKRPLLNKSTNLGDVRDDAFLATLFKTEAPELVFHAAALKHVPLAQSNPCEAILTNVLGTRNVADACKFFEATAMVQISTDKAVNPSSVMGATKWLAENYCQALDKTTPEKGTRFITVRFGNVLGSTGSVVPLFQQQLANGGPLTVTHQDVERYFMTVIEAVELVLQASVLALDSSQKVEDRKYGFGNLYVLDMGQPIRIQDLAKQIIRLSGLKPDKEVAIKYIGLRSGEKLSEELFHEWESLIPTTHEAIRLAVTHPTTLSDLENQLLKLTNLAKTRDTETSLSLLQNLVEKYKSPSTSKTIHRSNLF